MSVVEAIPVGRVTAEARATAASVHPGRALLALLAAMFLAVGWLAEKMWFAVVWIVTAVKVGWNVSSEARQAGGARGPAR